MYNLTEYTYRVTIAIRTYLTKGFDVEKLVNYLKTLQGQHRLIICDTKEENEIWFRFGDSPMAYDISDIEKDLSLPKGSGNKKLLLDTFAMVLSGEIKLKIHYY